jgi:alkylation response protein AidB-like acyl-CoA dehydrogenase
VDFGFSPELERFREQVRAALSGPGVRAALAKAGAAGQREPDLHPLYRELGGLGLLAVHWPAEYGGQGLSFTHTAIVAEEMVRHGIPDTLHVNTIQIVGQFVLMAGTPPQKHRYLPGMASGEHFASVLYTEPWAGSDLGALRTVAEPDGDGYRITGTKVFSLKTRFADLGLCAARTSQADSKYQGISLFLVDLHADGVRVSTIPSIAAEQFHQVELDGVRVPAQALIGREGEGWVLLSKSLAIERTGLDYYLKAERWLGAALACLAGSGLDGAGAGGQTLERIGRYGAAVEAGRLLCWDVLNSITAGQVDETAAAIAKYHTSELAAEIARWAASVPAPAQRLAGGPAAILAAAYLEAPGVTLAGGTSEIMLQLIAASLDTTEEDTG